MTDGIDKCPRCGLRHSSEECPSTMAAFHLSRMDPDYYQPIAPQAPSGPQAEPTAQWEDPRVQAVYNILCSEEAPPPEQHWEGWTARRIVDALAGFNPSGQPR